MSSDVLRGVVAHVVLSRAVQSGFVSKASLERQLLDLGATTAKTLCKSVTHVILQRKEEAPSEEERQADDEAARALFLKVQKVPSPPNAHVLDLPLS